MLRGFAWPQNLDVYPENIATAIFVAETRHVTTDDFPTFTRVARRSWAEPALHIKIFLGGELASTKPALINHGQQSRCKRNAKAS